LPTPTATALPIPPSLRLAPFAHQFQTWNNCGPATLAMALSHFRVYLTQSDTAAVLKPDPEDRNVSPEEMADYVNEQTDVAALTRTNGNLDTLRRLLAAGFPVIVELGLDPPGEYRWMGWYGHYLLVVAYDDSEESIWVYDSWFGTSQVPGENADSLGRRVTYDDLDRYWRQFSRNYIVLFPADQHQVAADIVGPDMDDALMRQRALESAQAELAGNDQDAFLWFNLGTAYTQVGDYLEAAASFDQARAIGLPWRMLWYQFGPLEAYYRIGRYDDVITLADVTLKDRPYFEEVFYYRGLALEAQGNFESAALDFERAARFNPNFAPAAVALARLRA
jgi:tetratricopeptide (TPR) repeat protein